MPRIRSVHPDICDDETLAGVSACAERTFVRLWTHLDDKGRGVDNPKLWKGKLYPLHDEVDEFAVEMDLCELADKGLLIRYEVDGKRYLSAKPDGWAKYQKPQHPSPSKLPEPPESSRPRVSLMRPHEDSRKPHEASCGSGVEGRGDGEGVKRPSEKRLPSCFTCLGGGFLDDGEPCPTCNYHGSKAALS